MITNLFILKGLHPGIVLDRELKQRKLAKGRFAISLNEYPQTLGEITKGKRRMNTSLALKVEKALGMEEGYFMILQVFYDIREEKSKQAGMSRPDLSKIRRVLFWDTDMGKIDWQKQKRAVIRRVFERGDDGEKEEIIRFYGKEVIDTALKEKERQKT
ncbi:MAG TPA: hypothetical protein VK543_11825 [Puia sp.]|nr:hypothetical protein [Puia sp.]